MSLCRCIECGSEHDQVPADCACTCGGLLEVIPRTPELPSGWQDRPLGVWRYKEFLPAVARAVTLQEGGTRLLEAPAIAEAAGIKRVQLKVEGDNPTGSFKDRGMTCAVSWALDHGADVLGCASTGNTAASMAAYAARAGAKAVVLLPAGQVALGKVSQSMVHGAHVVQVDGNFDAAMACVIDLARDGRLALLNSKNPIRLEGQKTLMYEVLDQRDRSSPDRVVYPVGNAGNISAGHRALLDYQDLNFIKELPRLTGIQAEGASPIARAIRDGTDPAPVPEPDTIATAIRIGDPVSAAKAMRAIRETDGTATAVPDAAITEAQQFLARREGVFAEPASCASVAGLLALASAGELERNEEVVCVLTGHGLKDPDAAMRSAKAPVTVPPTASAIWEAIA